jgi:hypothetical protein
MTVEFAPGVRKVVLALLLGGVATAAAAQDRPPRTLACGSYEAVTSGAGPSGRPTRVSIQKGGRLLVTVSNWAITRLDCRDIDGAGTPELLVASDSGGESCCETLRVWSLGVAVQPLLKFESGTARGFELRDLDRDGRYELLLGDDSFAYFEDLEPGDAPAWLPLVACLAGGRFEDCTARYPDLLRAGAKRFAQRLREPTSLAEEKPVEGAALGVLAVAALLGDEAGGVAQIKQAVSSDAVAKWIERARPKVREWAETRGRKLKDGK